MAEKFQNKYRIPSARLHNWDYGTNAAYFVTICTAGRQHFFGEIIINGNDGNGRCNNDGNGRCNNDGRRDVAMQRLYDHQLSEIGKIAQKYWLEIPNHFPFVELGEFIVMPNHVHGIIVINKKLDIPKSNNGNDGLDVKIDGNGRCDGDAIDQKQFMSQISPKSGSLSTIIRSYKSVVTKNARQIHADFAWQSRFHDHIIRNDQSFYKISKYIKNNPVNWEKDKFFAL